MNRSQVWSTLVGFGAAAAVFAVMFWIIGTGDILDALGRASLPLVGVAGGLMLGWVVVQGASLWVVWRILDISVPVRSAVLVFAGAAFANNLTPFGQAGGEPVAALLTTDVSDADYETALAAIAGADALNFVPSTGLGLVGSATYAVFSTVGPRLQSVVWVVGLFGLTVGALALAIWYVRDALKATVVRVLTPPLRLLARVVPRVSVPTPERVEDGVREFFASLERLAADPRRLARALALSTLGMVCQATAMWVIFAALGTPIPLYVPFFVIPVGTMAGIGPTPGGLGSIESVHVVLLTAMTGATAPLVAAAVVIHRIGGFWLTMTVGGGSLAVLRARARDA
ncbi:lysylphosphatidylglycerol synthase transmembrane domain-containing protein [Halobacterium rubrum]|uniref:lysylphosphatidylglycerol synthase transmembrane domain-containing protein n=1 Tax=Halobacterium TaxID=2239 RepID=UPI001F33FA0B|nr:MULTISPECIES: flippase-like domain-containing protein [Halobacterium]MDH5020180.1 flippase-like domain-containing protein [Halobacterium rubrum]